jgi:peptidoglycan/LPS O-acetylase OafA/YrhL
MVFNFHFLFTYTHKTMMGWGLGGENWGIHQLPIIHMVISGHVMVTIFFVISGYVLSHKPLKLLHSNSWERAFHTLASSTFRRGFRLYLPSIAGLFCVLVAVRLGLFHYSTMVREEGSTIRGINEQHPPIYHSLGRQIFDWYLTVVHLMDPWNWNLFYNSYNPHLWTIPVEFRCSILLFLTLLTTSKLRPRSRLCSVFALILFCVRWGRWDVVLFLSGLMLAVVIAKSTTVLADPPLPTDVPYGFLFLLSDYTSHHLPIARHPRLRATACSPSLPLEPTRNLIAFFRRSAQ